MNICLETLVMENNKNNSKLDTKEEQSKDTPVRIPNRVSLDPIKVCHAKREVRLKTKIPNF